MSTHGDLAIENYKHATIAPSNAWGITMYFYAGVHAVNHAIFGARFAPSDFDHRRRREWVRLSWALVDRVTYKDLEETSRIARYHAQQHPLPEVAVRDAKKACEDVLQRAGITLPIDSRPRAASASSEPT